MSLRTALVVAALAAFAGCTGTDRGPAIVIERGWVRAPVPGATMTAAYLTVENRSGEPVVIDAATSPEFADVTLHSVRIVDGDVQMRPIDGLTVPAGGSITLSPGGDHLMLAGPRVSLESIASVSLTLRAGDAPLVTVTLPVSRTSPWEENQ